MVEGKQVIVPWDEFQKLEWAKKIYEKKFQEQEKEIEKLKEYNKHDIVLRFHRDCFHKKFYEVEVLLESDTLKATFAALQESHDEELEQLKVYTVRKEALKSLESQMIEVSKIYSRNLWQRIINKKI